MACEIFQQSEYLYKFKGFSNIYPWEPRKSDMSDSLIEDKNSVERALWKDAVHRDDFIYSYFYI